MSTDKSTSRLLGATFLFQVFVPLVSGLFLSQPLIVPGSITGTMTNISNNVLQMRAGILGDMLTAMGIAALGALLFYTLRKQNEKVALVALVLYLLEAATLAASKIPAFALLRISQESAIAGHPAYLQTLGNVFYEAQSFGYSLHMLAFAVGATLFYSLFLKSGLIPRGLALFGLIAAPLAFVGIVLVLLGYDVSILVFLPSLPFELAIGIWLLVKGFNSDAVVSMSAKANVSEVQMSTSR